MEKKQTLLSEEFNMQGEICTTERKGMWRGDLKSKYGKKYRIPDLKKEETESVSNTVTSVKFDLGLSVSLEGMPSIPCVDPALG